MNRFSKIALLASLTACTVVVGTSYLAQAQDEETVELEMGGEMMEAEPVMEEGEPQPAAVAGFDDNDEQTSYALGVSMAQQLGGQLRGQGFPLDAEAMAEGLGSGLDGGEITDEAGRALSFGLGFDRGRSIGQNFEQMGVPFEKQTFTAGFRDALTQGEMKLTEEQVAQTLADFQQRMMLKQIQEQENAGEMSPEQTAAMEADRKEFDAQAQANLDAGQQFLEENAKREDVEQTESGLQYRILEPGNDAHPDANDVVTVHYTGTTLDDEVFDTSSKPRPGETYPKPVTFQLDEVIAGWTEGLQLIGEGGKIELWIPGPIAYGANYDAPRQGPGGPNALLRFEVELLDVYSQPNEGDAIDLEPAKRPDEAMGEGIQEDME